MSSASPAERARENVTGIVSILVTGLWMGAMFAGFEWWLAVLLVGYIVVVPLTAMLFGEEDEQSVRDETRQHETTQQQSESTTDEDALETLRGRYARGELTDDQFERKLERLLETETIEDVEDRTRREREDDLNLDRSR